MRSKTARVLFSALLVATLGVVIAPMVSAIPRVSPSSGPAAGGTTVTGMVPPGFTAIAGGGGTGFALDETGDVWAWGSNNGGQLGNGTTTNSSRPVRVQAAAGELPMFTAIAEGAEAGHALDEKGNVWAWGDNGFGQFGNGTYNPSLWPVKVQAATGTLPAFTAIAPGYDAMYALDENGNVWAWGNNNIGQLGNGITAGVSLRPVRVQAAVGALPVFAAIAAGDRTAYALDVDGIVWAWGDNRLGQYGDGTTNWSRDPVRVQAAGGGTLPVFTSIDGEQGTGYALDVDGNVWAWGYNKYGQLGDGTTTNSSRPVQVQAASGTLPVFTAIAAGQYAGYALDVDGNVWAWGNNEYGMLGNGSYATSSRPVRVQAAVGETLPVFTAIAAGWQAGYALDETGGVWAWGRNFEGQLGNDTTGIGAYSLNPVQAQATLEQVQATVESVTFGGVAGKGLFQDGGTWTVTTPPGCGPVDVTVRYHGANQPSSTVTFPGGFTFGSPPSFTAQPVSATLPPGGVFTASVEARGDPVPNVRWQVLTGRTWVDVPGATGTVLRARPTASTTYRAVATNCWTDLEKSAYTAISATTTAVLTAPSPSATDPPASPKGTKVAVSMSKVTMVKNTTLKVVLPAGLAGGGVGLSWSSSSPKVATVNTTGVITARQPGRTVVTVSTPAGGAAKLTVTVVSKAVKAKAVQATLKGAGVKGSKNGKTKMKVGKTARLSVQPSPAGATLKKMPTFKSSKPKVASVDRTGLVTANKKGKTKITVRLAGRKTTIVVHVT
ncbi:MAG: Ig-like domain-containing protein [Micrococcales bacterium]|nr:Ig-like domain-containing protein [Micrococcales bacterium]